MRVKALQNHVVFQFEEAGVRRATHGQEREQFDHMTSWGFEFSDFDESLNMPRWVKVVSVGKDVDNEIKPGMRVLVEALKWTHGAPVKELEQTFWRTDDEHVLAVDDSVQPAE